MRTVSQSEYEKLLKESEVVEQDRHGIKVVRMPDGNFLKTFWCRRLVSSRRVYPEWLRFTLHAGALRRRDISTVEVRETVRIPHLKRTGVIYRPLEGKTLRQKAAAGEFDGALAERLGGFVAQLHRKGIHFHSLHLGNVLFYPDGSFGLIDISDMRIFLWPLGANTRMRNFNHLFRYKEDLQILNKAGMQEFLNGYLNASSPEITHDLQKTVQCWNSE